MYEKTHSCVGGGSVCLKNRQSTFSVLFKAGSKIHRLGPKVRFPGALSKVISNCMETG